MTEAQAADLVAMLTVAGRTLGCAESLTGGLVCAALTSVPGSSAAVRGGIVAYATAVKVSLLQVSATLLADRGAVDPDVVTQMAAGARRCLGADYGLATTGVAGPDSTDGKPVGTVYVAVAGPQASRAQALRLQGDRTQIREQSVLAALELLRSTLRADLEDARW
ncbi:MAG TPA: CinA family protein [Dermatophilaceae bacterium]|nr:CinA family protein [Dermatophilaceae bacterium]